LAKREQLGLMPMGEDASLAEFAIGSHSQVRVSGRRSSRQQGRKGTVVEFGQTGNAGGLHLAASNQGKAFTATTWFRSRLRLISLLPARSALGRVLTVSTHVIETETSPTAVQSIRFDRPNQVRDPEQALTDPPDAIGAQEQLGRVVHVAKLHMVPVGDHVD
jgi:hypothetical protein